MCQTLCWALTVSISLVLPNPDELVNLIPMLQIRLKEIKEACNHGDKYPTECICKGDHRFLSHFSGLPLSPFANTPSWPTDSDWASYSASLSVLERTTLSPRPPRQAQCAPSRHM